MCFKLSEMIMAALSIGNANVVRKNSGRDGSRVPYRYGHPADRWQVVQSVDPKSSEVCFYWSKRKQSTI